MTTSLAEEHSVPPRLGAILRKKCLGPKDLNYIVTLTPLREEPEETKLTLAEKAIYKPQIFHYGWRIDPDKFRELAAENGFTVENTHGPIVGVLAEPDKVKSPIDFPTGEPPKNMLEPEEVYDLSRVNDYIVFDAFVKATMAKLGIEGEDFVQGIFEEHPVRHVAKLGLAVSLCDNYRRSNSLRYDGKLSAIASELHFDETELGWWIDALHTEWSRGRP